MVSKSLHELAAVAKIPDENTYANNKSARKIDDISYFSMFKW